MADRQLEELTRGESSQPHALLGAHPTAGGVFVRVFQPHATTVNVRPYGREPIPMKRVLDAGVWEAEVPGARMPFRYLLDFTGPGAPWTSGDPYRFWPTISDGDLAPLHRGQHHALWKLLGAREMDSDGEAGVSFTVWAPNARAVSVVGDFNGWDRRIHPMRTMGQSGVWEIFLPGIAAGERYKFSVFGADGIVREKSDPLGQRFEVRPASATIVDTSRHTWGDADWMEQRKRRNPYHQPMSVYEMHLGSWRQTEDGRWLNYRELGELLAKEMTELGYTHVELLPVCEHPYDGSWGYQVTGFFAPTSRFGTPDDFRAFVDTLHRAGIGVFMDWVPAHFATDNYSLERFDGTYLYDHEDQNRRVQPDWGTYSFNYGRNEVRDFLISSALYWLDEFHIDGLRVDAVSAMVYLDYSREHGQWSTNEFGGREHLEAVEFLRQMNTAVYARGDGAITIAEESTAWPAVSRPIYEGGLGFGFKWNMGWMHDTLKYFSDNPIYRRYHQGMLTFSMVYAYTENYVLGLSHDEVVHGKASLLHKMPGDDWQQFANLRALYAYQYAFPGKKLLFMGSEFGQRSDWNDAVGLEWHALAHEPHRQLRDTVRELNHLYRDMPALHALDHEPAGFSWLDFGDADNSVIAFVRHGTQPGDDVVCVFNFTPVPRAGYRIPIAAPGSYREIFNSDAARFGGSNVLNEALLQTEEVPYVGRDDSLVLTLPPLGGVFLRREGS